MDNNGNIFLLDGGLRPKPDETPLADSINVISIQNFSASALFCTF